MSVSQVTYSNRLNSHKPPVIIGAFWFVCFGHAGVPPVHHFDVAFDVGKGRWILIGCRCGSGADFCGAAVQTDSLLWRFGAPAVIPWVV